jgi:hypothetical protein
MGLAERKGNYHLHRRGSYFQLCLRSGRANEYCRGRVRPSAFPAARPGTLLAVVVGMIVASIAFHLDKSGVKVVGKVSSGLPPWVCRMFRGATFLSYFRCQSPPLAMSQAPEPACGWSRLTVLVRRIASVV